jgi:splicing factor U2AF subunit
MGIPAVPQMVTPQIPVQPQLSQLTRPMRRLYVGGLPAPCYDFMLTTFLNQALMALGICQVAGKSPIIACQVTPERNFAFIEFGDTSDATAALQLDGIPFRGNTLKIKRPKDYTPPFGAPPDPTPLGPMIMAQLLANNSVTDGAGGVAAAPAVQLPPGGLPLPGAGFPGAAANMGAPPMPPMPPMPAMPPMPPGAPPGM